jgi:hypothetical protein
MATIRKVSYVYVTAPNRAGQATRVLTALRDAGVNLLAFSGFPQGRGMAQIDKLWSEKRDGLAVARREGWKLSRPKRVPRAGRGPSVRHSRRRGRGTEGQRIAADGVTAGTGRFE